MRKMREVGVTPLLTYLPPLPRPAATLVRVAVDVEHPEQQESVQYAVSR